MNWFLMAVKRYDEFYSRSQRAEYWYFTLFHVLIFLGLSLIDYVTGLYSAKAGAGLLSGLFLLAMLVPSIAVTIRRLHDTGRSGWWIFISFIPLIGSIALLVFLILDSAPDNAYGRNPKAVAS
jgi:uncharacterized membrane protein YhaH (DUF805 family)